MFISLTTSLYLAGNLPLSERFPRDVKNLAGFKITLSVPIQFEERAVLYAVGAPFS